MNKAIEFLNSCKTFHVATVEGDQPRVRPFGAVAEFKGKTYICTNNTKDVFKQIQSNAKIEICAIAPDGKWIRITAKAIADPDRGAKEEMLKANPMLKSMYSLDDKIFEVLYLQDATAVISSFTGLPETFTF
jgi:uncharacterized pyridoxamine 5'-phosphate oxidase family protein